MKKILLSSVAFAVLGLSSAFAADLPSRKSAPVFVPVPVYNWTGFYAGANAGWGWGDGNARTIFFGNAGRVTGDADGFLGGVQVGYNFQTGPWVLGVEADFQGSTGEGNARTVAGPFTFTSKVETPWFGTLRGRVGYAFDRWMIYGTAGGLYGRSELSGIIPNGGPFSRSKDYFTYVVGAGVEAALWDRWTAKAEYLYAGTPSDAPAVPGTAALNGDTSTHMVRVGLNYRF